MRQAEFSDWLVGSRRLKPITARSYAGRALAVEGRLGADLDGDWRQSRLARAFHCVDADCQLGNKTKADYRTALNAYSEFCA